MAPYDNAGRIPKTSFVVASVILFVLAVVFTVGRIVIRLHYQRSLAVDDAFLIFAVVSLIVALGLLFAFISSMYLVEALITNDPNIVIPSDILDQVARVRKLTTVFNMLTFNTAMAVKFSFLFLFKTLIRNVRNMKIYWWTVVLITAAAWAFGIVEFFLLCPSYGSDSLKCAQTSEYPKTLGWAIAVQVQDLLTDFLIIVIPILLLWHVKIKLQQKLALGFCLCLSIMMMISTIVKLSGIHAPTNNLDITWGIFWQIVEACIAVIMVSLTAFRSLFVAHGAGARSPPQKPSLRKRLLNSRIAVGRKRAAGDDSEDAEGLPDIPRATMTGIRTFIQGDQADGSVTKSLRSGDTVLSWPLEGESMDQTIVVQHDMWQKSEDHASSQASSQTQNPSDDQFV